MTVPQRAALDLRVSTARQAEHDVSIADEKRQGEAVAPHAATSSSKPMWSWARRRRRPQARVPADDRGRAHLSRALRRGDRRLVQPLLPRPLRVGVRCQESGQNGVRLVSITQEMGDDPMHVMMRADHGAVRRISVEGNAKHVIRALNENAWQGFWSGPLPPIGYRVVAAEMCGAKVKKKLAIDLLHAETVRLIHRLALHGDDDDGQMVVKTFSAI